MYLETMWRKIKQYALNVRRGLQKPEKEGNLYYPYPIREPLPAHMPPPTRAVPWWLSAPRTAPVCFCTMFTSLGYEYM